MYGDDAKRPMFYRWEQCPNPAINLLHIDRLLPSAWMYGETIGGIRKLRPGVGPDEYIDPSPDDVALLDDLIAIPGVVSVTTTHKYQMQVEKGTVFGWPEVRTAIVGVLERRLNVKASDLGDLIGPRYDRFAESEPEPATT
jgi:hypothetical protein